MRYGSIAYIVQIMFLPKSVKGAHGRKATKSIQNIEIRYHFPSNSANNLNCETVTKILIMWKQVRLV